MCIEDSEIERVKELAEVCPYLLKHFLFVIHMKGFIL